MTGSQHFSADDIQLKLLYNGGQCAKSSYRKNYISFNETKK